MKLIAISFSVVGAFLLTSCGTQVALSGRAYDDYQRSIKPYIAYWEKPGASEETRLKDWLACGGQPNGNFGVTAKNHLLPGETESAARTRLEFEFQRCMIRSGYRYTGDCSSDYMKARPLCGAP